MIVARHFSGGSTGKLEPRPVGMTEISTSSIFRIVFNPMFSLKCQKFIFEIALLIMLRLRLNIGNGARLLPTVNAP